MTSKRPRAPRKCPTAYPGSQARSVDTDRTVVLSTGRGDSRLTPAEARKLAAELLAAAEADAGNAKDGETGDQQPTQGRE